MATPNVGILTTAGKALIDKVNSGQAKISFSKIVFSSMDNSQLSDMQVKALTAIAPQEVVVSSPETTLDANSGETRIRATGTNEKLADGVYVKTYGVFAKDDTGSEILYGVTVSPNPNYFPAYDGVTPQAVTYSYKTVIQETSNITMTNSNDVYASQEDLTEAIQPYAKTVDVNQQLDKKVNVSDMRKPASDVAGIEEVNAKQDKIGYTPADDSKVVHDNHDNTITANNFIYDLSKSGLTPISLYSSGSFNDLPLGTVFADATKMTDGPNNTKWFTTTTFYFSYYDRKAQIAIADSENLMYLRIKNVDNWTSWTLLSDDSKVAHLSGANNFNTVPTVNNNPLLLASSLPSDLARTGSDQEFTGKNSFDIAPTDKTTGKPYITKDGVPSIPSDVARTSQQTNFPAGLKSGGVDVATAADLKSVADKAWYQLDNKYIVPASGYTLGPTNTLLYKINDITHTLYLSGSIALTDDGASNVPVTVKLGSIIKSILTLSVPYFGYDGISPNWVFRYANNNNSTNLTFFPFNGVLGIASNAGKTGGYAFVHYDELV